MRNIIPHATAPLDPRGSRQMDMPACPLGSLLAGINIRTSRETRKGFPGRLSFPGVSGLKPALYIKIWFGLAKTERMCYDTRKNKCSIIGGRYAGYDTEGNDIKGKIEYIV